MEDRLRLDIEEIWNIVNKTEDENFRFYNPKRNFDGFVLITSDRGTVTDEKGRVYEVEEGDMVFVNKGDEYTIESAGGCSYITSGIKIDMDLSLLPFLYRCSERQVREIKNICKIWQARAWDSFAKCRVGLMAFYLEVIENTRKSEGYETCSEKAIRFIHENFKINFSGKEIAEYCSVSLSHLRGEFLRNTGVSIVKYRDRLRISAAKEMLASGHFTVTEIATELGYCDVYHFSRTFTTYVGCSPTKWTKKHRVI